MSSRPAETAPNPDSARATVGATGGGVVASAFALLCCAGFAPVLGVLSAIGLGFVINDAVLIPLLVLGLGLTLWGLRQGRRCHGRTTPAVLGLVGSALALGGLFVWVPLAFAGYTAIVAASAWNVWAVRACVVQGSPPVRAAKRQGVVR